MKEEQGLHWPPLSPAPVPATNTMLHSQAVGGWRNEVRDIDKSVCGGGGGGNFSGKELTYHLMQLLVSAQSPV